MDVGESGKFLCKHFWFSCIAINYDTKYRAVRNSCLSENTTHYKYNEGLYLPLYIINEYVMDVLHL